MRRSRGSGSSILECALVPPRIPFAHALTAVVLGDYQKSRPRLRRQPARSLAALPPAAAQELRLHAPAQPHLTAAAPAIPGRRRGRRTPQRTSRVPASAARRRTGTSRPGGEVHAQPACPRHPRLDAETAPAWARRRRSSTPEVRHPEHRSAESPARGTASDRTRSGVHTGSQARPAERTGCGVLPWRTPGIRWRTNAGSSRVR